MTRVERIALDEPSGSHPFHGGNFRAQVRPLACANISRIRLRRFRRNFCQRFCGNFCRRNAFILKHNAKPRLDVPNQITLLRLGFLPLFIVSISYEHYRWALVDFLVIAGLSDAIDGLLARSLNQRSSLGAYLDPIADKLLLSSSFVILAFKHEIAMCGL